MPRVTRKDRARALVQRLTLGPAFQLHTETECFTPYIAAVQYQRWVKMFVLPEIKTLIPELAVKPGPAIQSPENEQAPKPGSQGGQ